MNILLYILFHLVCAILGHGILFAYFQRQFRSIAADSWREDMAFIAVIHLFGGPIALLMSLTFSGFAKHGFLYRPSRR